MLLSPPYFKITSTWLHIPFMNLILVIPHQCVLLLATSTPSSTADAMRSEAKWDVNIPIVATVLCTLHTLSNECVKMGPGSILSSLQGCR